MKGINLTPVFLLLFTLNNWGQNLLLEENFCYSSGSNLEDNGWLIKSGSTNSIVIESTNLNFTNYPSSSGGSIKVDASGCCYYKSIGSQFASGSIYVSLLVNVTSAYSGTNDNFIFSLGSSSAGSQAGRLHIKKSGSNFAFGLSKTTEPVLYTSYTYNFNITYLVVIKYTIISGSSNDKAYLYIIDESIPADDSSPAISVTNETESNDPSNIEVVYVRQEVTSNIAYIDGIRVATSWYYAPFPVELSSFTAIIVNDKVQLNWVSATEVDNYGFNVERASMLLGKFWETLGFIHGYGISNSPKKYYFLDAYPPVGIVLYRLKQIDFDGTFEYSEEVSASIVTPKKLELHQNFPNPFNPVTEIRYLLPSTSPIHLSIYNSIGQKVATLIDQIQNAGIHTIIFNGSNLSGGIYLYKLTTPEYSIMKKMVLLK